MDDDATRVNQDLWVLGACWIVREHGQFTVYADGMAVSSHGTLAAAEVAARIDNGLAD